MRPTLLILVLLTGGCSLVEYVLPDGTSAGGTEDTGGPGETVVTGATGDTPTGAMDASDGDGTDETGATSGTDETGATSGTDTMDATETGDACGEGRTRCDGACVDLSRDDAHCGKCSDECKSDERCVASQCLDVLVVECEGCPCAACPEGEGLLASTTGEGEGGGDDPQRYLCCPLGDMDGAVCLVGDPEDVLLCPGAAT